MPPPPNPGERDRDQLSRRWASLYLVIVGAFCWTLFLLRDGDTERDFLLLVEGEWHKQKKTINFVRNSSQLVDAHGTLVAVAATDNRLRRQQQTHVRARVFPSWRNMTSLPLPCVVDEPGNADWDPFNKKLQRQPSNEGLLFVKIDKAGSSTISGVGARIAHAIFNLTHPDKVVHGTNRACRTRLAHLWSLRTDRFGDRDKTKSFLWTFLRDPGSRALSAYSYYRVGRRGAESSTASALDFLTNVSNTHLKYTTDYETRDRLSKMSYDELKHEVSKTLNEFNFIGILERLDESLVLLQLILDLRTSDVLYLSAKRGGYDSFNKCKKVPEKFRNDEVDIFFSSHIWKRNNAGDYLLYDSANRSIDLTIEAVGRTRFERALRDFRRAKALVDRDCEVVNTDCMGEGIKRPKQERLELRKLCYWGDSGCGYTCIDRLFPITTISNKESKQ